MFAVVDILGQQFKVAENTKYYVPRLKDKIDTEVTFDSVLILSDDKKVKQKKHLQSVCHLVLLQT